MSVDTGDDGRTDERAVLDAPAPARHRAVGPHFAHRIIARLAGLNLLNLGLGFLLNTLLAAQLGATATKDALDAAIAISSNLVQTLGLASLGGSTLYIIGRSPSDLRTRGSSFLSTTALLQFGYSLFVLVVIWVSRDTLLSWIAPTLSGATRSLLDDAFRFTIWLVLLRPFLTLLSSAVMGLKDYGAQQLGSAVERIGGIVGVLAISLTGALAYPVGVVMGVVVACGFVWRRAARLGLRVTYPAPIRSEEVRAALRLSVPWMLTSPIFNITSWVFIPLMLKMPAGSFAAYGYATLLNTTLVTLMLRPLSDWLAPVLAEAAGAASRGEGSGRLARLTIRATRASLIMGSVLAVATASLAPSIVGLLYFRGAMTPEAAQQVAVLTAVLGLGLIGRSILVLCARLFQAQLQTWKYIVIQVFEPVISVSVAFALIDRWGVIGIAIGSTTSATVGGSLGLYLISRGYHSDQALIGPRLAAWIVGVFSIAALVVLFPIPLTPSVGFNLLSLTIGSAVLASWILVLAYTFRVDEVTEIGHSLLARMRQR